MNTRLTPVFTPADRGCPRDLSLPLRGGEVYLSHQLVCPCRARRGFTRPRPPGCINTPVSMSKLKWAARQINVMQLMAAGQADCTLGDNGRALETWQAGVHRGDRRYLCSSTRRRCLITTTMSVGEPGRNS